MNDERKFLHDISSPLTSVILNLENIVDMLQEKNPEDLETCLKMMNNCIHQTKRASEMIKERREIVKGSGK